MSKLNPKEAITQIKKLLGFSEAEQVDEVTETDETKEESFAVTFLSDGETQVTNNREGDFELGDVIYIINDNGDLIPAPTGEHETESGFIIVLDEESILTEMREPEDEEEAEENVEEEAEVEEEMSEEEEEINFADEIANIKSSIQTILDLIGQTNDTFNSQVDELKQNLEAFKDAQSEKGITERKPVNQNFRDYKVELLKKYINK